MKKNNDIMPKENENLTTVTKNGSINNLSIRELLKKRKPPKSYTALTGMLATKKGREFIYFESSLERDLAYLLEHDSRIKTYIEQPYTIHYEHDGKARRYTPDFHIEFERRSQGKFLGHHIDGTNWIVEVKYQKDLIELKETDPVKLQAAEKFCSEKNMSFVILTEEDIRGTLLDNVMFFRQYWRESNFTPGESKSEYFDRISSFAKKNNMGLTANNLKEIAVDHEDLGYLIRALWTMVALDFLIVDLNSPITNSTFLKLL